MQRIYFITYDIYLGKPLSVYIHSVPGKLNIAKYIWEKAEFLSRAFTEVNESVSKNLFGPVPSRTVSDTTDLEK